MHDMAAIAIYRGMSNAKQSKVNPTIRDLDNAFTSQISRLGDQLAQMERHLVELSPVRWEVSVPCAGPDVVPSARLDLPPDMIAFTCRKNRWGMYYKIGSGENVELRDISQMSVEQRMRAAYTFESLLQAMVDMRLSKIAMLQAANDVAVRQLAMLPIAVD